MRAAVICVLAKRVEVDVKEFRITGSKSDHCARLSPPQARKRRVLALPVLERNGAPCCRNKLRRRINLSTPVAPQRLRQQRCRRSTRRRQDQSGVRSALRSVPTAKLFIRVHRLQARAPASGRRRPSCSAFHHSSRPALPLHSSWSRPKPPP